MGQMKTRGRNRRPKPKKPRSEWVMVRCPHLPSIHLAKGKTILPMADVGVSMSGISEPTVTADAVTGFKGIPKGPARAKKRMFPKAIWVGAVNFSNT